MNRMALNFNLMYGKKKRFRFENNILLQKTWNYSLQNCKGKFHTSELRQVQFHTAKMRYHFIKHAYLHFIRVCIQGFE